jgi:uncharacterized protein
VVEVDIKRKRIGLSMRKDAHGNGEGGGDTKPAPREPAGKYRAAPSPRQPERPASQGAFGAALADAMKRK